MQDGNAHPPADPDPQANSNAQANHHAQTNPNPEKLMKKEDNWLRVEFHCHTDISMDSSNHLPRLLQLARRRGMDRLAITDHNTIANAIRAREMDPELVIVGEEIKTTAGELLAYFVTRGVTRDVSPMQAINLLKQQNAFISLAHPFDHQRSSWTAAELEEILPYLDAVEVFNSRCFNPSANRAALEFAEKNRLAKMVGSDAHSQVELGLATLHLPQFGTADELRQAIQLARMDTHPISPWAHVGANALILVERWLPWNWNR